ncbi:MAG: S1 RNA-binding domain-containing protein, partial [Pseudomonadota bacterium]
MARRMLVDATHAEETRVVVVNGNRLEEFDFETASKKQLKGNIYLARVTRVEPSLQAAFVEYGGNRHGFLAFSEIHPDYYRIPIADREALIEQDQAKSGDDAEDSDDEANGEDGADPVETVGGDDADEVVERRSTRPQRSYKIQEVI